MSLLRQIASKSAPKNLCFLFVLRFLLGLLHWFCASALEVSFLAALHWDLPFRMFGGPCC